MVAIRKRLYATTKDDVTAFFATKRGTPFVEVHTKKDGVYDVISPTKLAGKIFKTGISNSLGVLEKTALIHYKMGREYDYARFPRYFDVRKNLDKADLFKVLLQQFGISSGVIEKYFGKADLSDSFVVYKDAKILYPPGTTDRVIVKVERLIDSATKFLKKKRMDWLTGGEYIITPLGKNIAGQYNTASRMVSIDPRHMRASDIGATRTLIHELGHKLEQEKNLTAAIRKKFQETAEYRAKTNGVVNIEKGEVLLLHDYRPLKGVPLVVTGVAQNDIKVSYVDPARGTRRQGTIPFNLVARGLVVNYYSKEPYEYTATNPWYPTKYSRTNAHEFFAENFLFWIMGESSEEVNNWFKKLGLGS